LAAMSALRIAKSPEPTDSHCVPPSRFRSCTVRTARSRSSGENCLPAFCVMAPSPHRSKLPGSPERFTGKQPPPKDRCPASLNDRVATPNSIKPRFADCFAHDLRQASKGVNRAWKVRR
jgi:hypothetical protein